MMADTLVLGYHAVSPNWHSTLAVSPEDLEAQLRLLSRQGYRGVTFSEAVHGSDEQRRVAVTFDDSYRSVGRLAAPILAELGWPGTVFVPTAFAGAERPMSWPGIEEWVGGPYEDELIPMDWPELGELQAAGWEVGSHTRSHPRLTELDDATLREELEGSRRDCEAGVDRECLSLAYPYGDHDDRVIAACEAAGYTAACTLPGQLHPAKDTRWPRVGVYPVDGDGWRFRAKVSPTVRALRASSIWTLVDRIRG